MKFKNKLFTIVFSLLIVTALRLFLAILISPDNHGTDEIERNRQTFADANFSKLLGNISSIVHATSKIQSLTTARQAHKHENSFNLTYLLSNEEERYRNGSSHNLKIWRRDKKIKISTTGRKIPEELYKVAPIVFDTVPLKFDENFKNPCWWESKTLRCLPYFYLLGEAKCGTTDLWDKIAKHPQVVGRQKEFHWWNLHRFKPTDPQFKFSKYISTLTSWIQRTYPKTGGTSKAVVGDGTPATLADNCMLEDVFPDTVDGPPYLNADVIHDITPDVKLIVILREPIKTLESAYKFFDARDHKTPEALHQSVTYTLDLFTTCLKKNSFRACVYNSIKRNTTDPFPRKARIKPAFAWVYLHDWLSLFPRDQLKVIELGDWHSNCLTILPEIYRFLELDPVSESDIKSFCHVPVKNQLKTQIRWSMLPETRRILQDFFRPLNIKLYELLQDEKFSWTYS